MYDIIDTEGKGKIQMGKVNVEVVGRLKYESGLENDLRLSDYEKRQFQSEMVKYARNFLKRNFDMDLGIPIKIDARLSRAGGSFHYKGSSNTPVQIKISERFMVAALQDEDGVSAILDILGHELVHYALCAQGKPFDDGHPLFEGKLEELNIGTSGSTPESKQKSKKKNVWYRVVDVYRQGNRTYRHKHTMKAQDWLGKREEIIFEKLVK